MHRTLFDQVWNVLGFLVGLVLLLPGLWAAAVMLGGGQQPAIARDYFDLAPTTPILAGCGLAALFGLWLIIRASLNRLSRLDRFIVIALIFFAGYVITRFLVDLGQIRI